MVAFNVTVIRATGSVRQNAELFLASGIIKFENGTFSHIQNEIAQGKEVVERIEAPALAREVREELKKEEEQQVRIPVATKVRSESPKKKQGKT